MTVDDLVLKALDEVVRQDDGPVPCLAALHSRPTHEVFDAAVQLLRSESSAKRELGARVLRELGPEGARPFSREAEKVLIERLVAENSPRVTGWIISALGYNSATDSLKGVLHFAQHEDAFVRFHVAAAIPSLMDNGSSDAVATIEEMISDPDADVRFYAAYAFLEELRGISQERKNELAGSLLNDNDQQIRSFAQSWMEG